MCFQVQGRGYKNQREDKNKVKKDIKEFGYRIRIWVHIDVLIIRWW